MNNSSNNSSNNGNPKSLSVCILCTFESSSTLSPTWPPFGRKGQVLDNSADAGGGSDLFPHTREEAQPSFQPHLPLGPGSSMHCSPGLQLSLSPMGIAPHSSPQVSPAPCPPSESGQPREGPSAAPPRRKAAGLSLLSRTRFSARSLSLPLGLS